MTGIDLHHPWLREMMTLREQIRMAFVDYPVAVVPTDQFAGVTDLWGVSVRAVLPAESLAPVDNPLTCMQDQYSEAREVGDHHAGLFSCPQRVKPAAPRTGSAGPRRASPTRADLIRLRQAPRSFECRSRCALGHDNSR